jgi:hypothetical protein
VPSSADRTGGVAWTATHQIDAGSLTGFLDAKLAAGAHPNTVRTYVGMLRAYYRREYESERISGDLLLAVLSVKPPRESSRRAQPQPYRHKELAAMWSRLEERWPKLPDDEAWHWIGRWREGRSPYSHIRTHAIRCPDPRRGSRVHPKAPLQRSGHRIQPVAAIHTVIDD